MANTFVKIYLHIVFAVKNRDCAIPPIHEADLHRFLAGVIRDNGHFVKVIGGTDNHVHILMSYENLQQTIPDLMRQVKGSSSRFFNEQRFIKCRFEWQRGYAVMSYSPSHLEALTKYISNQHEHHHNVSLEDEVRNMLRKFDIPFDEKYIIRVD